MHHDLDVNMIKCYFPSCTSAQDCEEVDFISVFETEVLDLKNMRHETDGKGPKHHSKPVQ